MCQDIRMILISPKVKKEINLQIDFFSSPITCRIDHDFAGQLFTSFLSQLKACLCFEFSEKPIKIQAMDEIYGIVIKIKKLEL